MLSTSTPLLVEERYNAGFRSGTDKCRNGVLRGWHKNVMAGEESLYQEIKMPTNKGGWLGACVHDVASEVVIVHRGKIALAKLVSGKVSITTYKNGELFRSEALISRNIFLYPGSTIMVIRYNDYQPSDQHPCSELDEICLGLGVQELEAWINELQPMSCV